MCISSKRVGLHLKTYYMKNIYFQEQIEVLKNSSSSKVGNVPNEIENIATFRGNRLEGEFVSKNFINLSRRKLCSAEISLLSKGLKSVLTANKIDQAKS